MSDNATRAREIVDSYFGSTFKGSNSTVDRCSIERFCEHVLSLSAPTPAPVAGDVEDLFAELRHHGIIVTDEIEASCRSALSAARSDAVKPFVEAGLATEDGKPRGFARRDDGMPSTLEINKDGEIVGHGAIQWRYNKASQEMERMEFRLVDIIKPSRVVAAEICYSTLCAAHVAKENP